MGQAKSVLQKIYSDDIMFKEKIVTHNGILATYRCQMKAPIIQMDGKKILKYIMNMKISN